MITPPSSAAIKPLKVPVPMNINKPDAPMSTNKSYPQTRRIFSLLKININANAEMIPYTNMISSPANVVWHIPIPTTTQKQKLQILVFSAPWYHLTTEKNFSCADSSSPDKFLTSSRNTWSLISGVLVNSTHTRFTPEPIVSSLVLISPPANKYQFRAVLLRARAVG